MELKLIDILILFIAFQHIVFMVLEMFLWEQPAGRRIFRLSEDFAKQSSTLAANQGLYNGFIAGGLLYGLLLGAAGTNIIIYLLVCVVVAGIFGGLTVSRNILLVQAVPAIITLAVWYLY